MAILQVQGISKKYQNGSFALKKTDLAIKKTQKVGIVGETGSGKSTLLKIIAGLVQPTKGDVFFNNIRIEGPEEVLIPGHSSIAYLSQSFDLPLNTTVERALRRTIKVSEAEAQIIYKACRIKKLILSDTRQLSGGEKQRVALANAFLKAPEVLLLDEPFSNLDVHHKTIVKDIIDEVEAEFNTTVIFVSHDPMDVLSWAEVVIVMKSGKILQQDSPANIYHYPVNKYVAGLFGDYSLIDFPVSFISDKENFHSLNNKTMLRPEDFEITSNSNEAIMGKIKSIRYLGRADRLILRSSFGNIIVDSPPGKCAIGQEISVNLIKK